MNTPKLRFKEFSGEWTASNLEKTTEYFKGFAFKSELYKEDGIRIIRVSDLDKDSIKHQNETIFLDKNEAKNYLNWEVKKEDIIVTTVGSKPHLIDSAVGRPIFVKNNNEGLLNQNLLILRPQNENIDAYFIFAQLLNKKYLTHIETIQRGNANQSNITVKDLQEFQVFQTSKPEQTQIATFLTAVDEKISQLSQKQELLAQYKKGMMQKLFSQQIRFKADDGSEFGAWKILKFKDVINIKYGKDHKNVADGDIPVFGTGGIMRYVNEYLYDGESILIGRKGTIDKPKFISGKFWTVDTLFYTDISKKLLPKFAYFQLLLINWLELNEATGVPSLNTINIGNIDLKLASIPEQTKIANFLSSIDQKIDLTTQQLEQAKQWKKGLLQHMFI